MPDVRMLAHDALPVRGVVRLVRDLLVVWRVMAGRRADPAPFRAKVETTVGSIRQRGGGGIMTHDEKIVVKDEDTRPDWTRKCGSCGEKPVVPLTGLCGPCTFGKADTAGGNW